MIGKNLPNINFSDHNRIVFQIELILNKTRPFRNTRGTVCEMVVNIPADKELDESVSPLARTLNNAYESSFKASHSSKKFHQL